MNKVTEVLRVPKRIIKYCIQSAKSHEYLYLKDPSMPVTMKSDSASLVKPIKVWTISPAENSKKKKPNKIYV